MLKKIGKKFLGGMVILALVYAFASKGYISHLSNTFEEMFSHTCMKLVTQETFYNTSKTYKEAFANYFKDGNWKYFDSSKGNIIEYNGKCKYMNQEVDCTMQFLVSNDKKSFELTYLGFNKIPQSKLICMALIESITKDNMPKVENAQPNETNMNTNGGDTIHNNPNYKPDDINNSDDFNEHPEKYGIATGDSDAGC